jgi:Zn-dependent protease
MRDREPHHWSLPLPWRPLGVSVRIHILFPCVALGVVLWVATSRQFEHSLWPQACAVMAMLFVSVLLHEFGHVFGARRVDGDVPDVLLWPLGGLAFADVPHAPRCYFWATVGGLAVNLGLALAAAGGLAVMGFVAPPNPLASPLNPRMYNWRDGKTYFSVANPGEAELYYYTEPIDPMPKQVKLTFTRDENGHKRELPPPVDAETIKTEMRRDAQDHPHWFVKERGYPLLEARMGKWEWLLAQLFTVNWFLFCINLLPAFPLDGSRLLQAWLWRRRDYRQATATAAFVGFIVMLGVGVYAIAVGGDGILPAGLAAVIYICCRQQLLMLERGDEDERPPGYDFSEGYTSLEREEEPAPPTPPPPPRGWLQRWLHDRAERRRLREEQRREAEERRLDELLDKIHRGGRQALTPEELRFLTRVSGRYPNRKSSP